MKQLPVEVIPEGVHCYKILGNANLQKLNIKICPYLEIGIANNFCNFLDIDIIGELKECQVNTGFED